MNEQPLIGNAYDKYGTRNPLARHLMAGFLRAVTALYNRVAPDRVLEVGCGEGHLAGHLLDHAVKPPASFHACDLSLSRVVPEHAHRASFLEASIYALPYPAHSFDLVICCEVLEHLAQPTDGMRELARVSRGPVLVSTPWEPAWRILNVMRMKYLMDFGNTPGHVQHFSRSGLRELVGTQLKIVAESRPLPWTVLLGDRCNGAR